MGALDVNRLEEELGGYVEREGDAQWLALPAGSAELAAWPLPDRWRAALADRVDAVDIVTALWADLGPVLPRTFALVTERLSGLALLRTVERGVSLVYVFDNGGLEAVRGFVPPPVVPAIGERFPIDLARLYLVHDGLVQLAGDDGGPLPVAAWRTVVDPASNEASLVVIAANGPDFFGFDVSVEPPAARAVFPDEEFVEAVDDGWAFLDEMLAGPFDD